MKCSDLQLNLSLYSDGNLTDAENFSVGEHLVVCPLCRQKASEFREIKKEMFRLKRPELPSALKNSLKISVRSRVTSDRRAFLPVTSDVREWLQMRLMPFGVGVFASVAIAFVFLTMMFSGMLQRVPTSDLRGDSSIMLANNSNPFADYDSTAIMPLDYVQSRLAVSAESPSINPQGALIALTKSLIRGEMKDEEVVVVAEVFSNGLAKVTQVVEPSHDQNAIRELEKALQSDPAYSPFVPSVMESRPENMLVVLKFQSVNVSTGLKKN